MNPMRKKNKNRSYSQVVNNKTSFNKQDKKNLIEVNNITKLLLHGIQEKLNYQKVEKS